METLLLHESKCGHSDRGFVSLFAIMDESPRKSDLGDCDLMLGPCTRYVSLQLHNQN